ncbi:hypothetical protein SARC_08981 [Sphaeroforma arctica JP610]|uniref:Uncharacterized protein n=1 Tax=Sphaeroforma arctica JP610 TaxID=667725 RepID=A0A0L0FRK3_9EUKA|nr:hypothetical protein SARC_08981 [Sphaeroforma arctica JP610]KNC78593.1 hypothetical protein SARC_08981 [Sphaeroforma arctica JP610]|eukprot:XP_014152495.1 hypothetical protein SARC_08981 [Sphaeroforma arctica JP610]
MAEDSVNQCISDTVSNGFAGLYAQNQDGKMKCTFFSDENFIPQASLDALPRIHPEDLRAQTGIVSYILTPLSGLWLDGQLGYYSNRIHSELWHDLFMTEGGQASCIYRANERGADGFYAVNQGGKQACYFFKWEGMRPLNEISTFPVVAEADLTKRTKLTSYIMPDPGCVGVEYSELLVESRSAEDECLADLFNSAESLSTCTVDKTQLTTDLQICTTSSDACVADKATCDGSLQTCLTNKAAISSQLTTCQVLTANLTTSFNACEASNGVLEQSVADISGQLATCITTLLDSTTDHDECTDALSVCSTASANCTMNLMSLTTTLDTCLADKTSQANVLAQCNTDFQSKVAESATLAASLHMCDSERSTLQLSLTASQTEGQTCAASLTTCESDLFTCNAEHEVCKSAMAQRVDLLDEFKEWDKRTDAWNVEAEELNAKIEVLTDQLAKASEQVDACACATEALVEDMALGCNAALRKERVGRKVENSNHLLENNRWSEGTQPQEIIIVILTI